MSTRNIKDAKDLNSGELIYFKGHAKATYMSDGTTVEDAINNIEVGSGTASNDYWDKGEYENLIVTNNDVEINGNLSLNHSKELNASLISCSAFHNSIDNCYLVYDKSGILLEDENTDEIFSVTNTGDGTKFLSDDGSYKTVSGGSSGGSKEIVVRDQLDGTGGIKFNSYYTAFEPNKIYIYTPSVSEGDISIELVTPPTGDYGEYSLIFSTYDVDSDLTSITTPSNWCWAKNASPSEIMEYNKSFTIYYELSVTASKVENSFVYRAVLTSFDESPNLDTNPT